MESFRRWKRGKTEKGTMFWADDSQIRSFPFHEHSLLLFSFAKLPSPKGRRLHLAADGSSTFVSSLHEHKSEKENRATRVEHTPTSDLTLATSSISAAAPLASSPLVSWPSALAASSSAPTPWPLCPWGRIEVRVNIVSQFKRKKKKGKTIHHSKKKVHPDYNGRTSSSRSSISATGN